MDNAFEGRDRACSETSPFHKRGVHSLDPIQLPFRATAGIEEPGVFKHADGTFDCEQGVPSLPEDGMARSQRLGKAAGLARRHCAPACTAVSEDQGTGTDQLRRRSLAC
jgi:hypothetical protein